MKKNPDDSFSKGPEFSKGGCGTLDRSDSSDPKPKPVVTIWRKTIRGDGYEPSRDVVCRRTVTEDQQEQLDLLAQQVEAARNGTNSFDYERALQRLEAYDASLTEVFDVQHLQDQSRTDRLAFDQCQELGILPQK